MEMRERQLGQRLADEIRAEMARQDMSRRQLAAEIGESHVTVGRWIKGETPMNPDVLDVIARALGLTIPDLLAAVERNGGYRPRELVRTTAANLVSALSARSSTDRASDYGSQSERNCSPFRRVERRRRRSAVVPLHLVDCERIPA